MSSVRIRLLRLFVLILFCEKYESSAFKQEESCTHKQSQVFYQMIGQDTTTSNSSVHSILEFLDDHIDELKFAKNQEIVFVIGTTDSDHNPTTLISLITDAELAAIETEPCSGVFIFVDKDGPLHQYSRNVVPELIPQLLPDKERGVDYYIMPNFNVATDVRSDLTAWHLVQRSLQFATDGVKFMLTLSSSKNEVKRKPSTEAKRKMRQLIRSATSFINDIDKYSEAISLIVTNVEYDPDESDIDEIQNVGYLLRKSMDDIYFELETSTPEESNALKKDIQLLKILLRKTKNEYTKLKIMRVANETGLVNDMPIFQKEKVEIMSMVRKNTKYIPADENDFSFNISNETNAVVPELVKEIKRRLSADVAIIDEMVKNIYTEAEEKVFDLDVLFAKMEKGYEAISQIKADDPRSLVQLIIKAADGLKIEISLSALDDILKHAEVYYFLIRLEGRHNSRLLHTANSLVEATKYLKDSKIWYAYLLKLHDILSEFKVQKNVEDYQKYVSDVMELCTIDQREQKKVKDIGLKQFLKLIGVASLDPTIEDMTVNSSKLKKLIAVLHRTMQDYGTKFCSPKRLLVQGYNVKISDVIKMNCSGDIQFREIFVINNLFIDADINEVGVDLQLMIISPSWEIIGTRSITLNGKDAEMHSQSAAPNGEGQNINGVAGKPGKKGFSAGCFTAVGDKFINDGELKVYLTGGRGD